jgi:deazaflavin-dependent oxidoreductase (nitroreductase family)
MTTSHSYNDDVIEEFRANSGKVGRPFADAPMLLLTTTGSVTGKARTSPMMYLDDGDRILVFASNAGSDRHPAWYRNLVADPDVLVELGDETFRATATPVTGAERDRLYARQAALYPTFAQYQARSSRVIPVVALKRLHP